MKIIKIKQHLSVFISLAFIFSIIAFSPIVHKAFAQPQQASATEPADGQSFHFTKYSYVGTMSQTKIIIF